MVDAGFGLSCHGSWSRRTRASARQKMQTARELQGMEWLTRDLCLTRFLQRSKFLWWPRQTRLQSGRSSSTDSGGQAMGSLRLSLSLSLSLSVSGWAFFHLERNSLQPGIHRFCVESTKVQKHVQADDAASIIAAASLDPVISHRLPLCLPAASSIMRSTPLGWLFIYSCIAMQSIVLVGFILRAGPPTISPR